MAEQSPDPAAPECPMCAKPMAVLKRPAPAFMPTATHRCGNCCGFVDGTRAPEGHLVLLWGQNVAYWPGDEDPRLLDAARLRAEQILAGKS